MYHSATWDSARAAHPTAWFGELCSIIANQFKSLTKEERAYWNDKARKDKEDYKQHIATLEQEFGKVNLSTNASGSRVVVVEEESKSWLVSCFGS